MNVDRVKDQARERKRENEWNQLNDWVGVSGCSCVRVSVFKSKCVIVGVYVCAYEAVFLVVSNPSINQL